MEKNNDTRSSEIYELLDQILSKTNKIGLIASERCTQKHEMLIDALQSIKDTLASIVQISSE